jgi:hypothetical protein
MSGTKRPGDRGVGQKYGKQSRAHRRLSHAQIFFLSRVFPGRSLALPMRIRLAVQGCASAFAIKHRIYFQAPRGPQKSGGFRSRTGGLGTQIISRNWENFFVGASDDSKNRREIRWGGGR